MVTLRFVEKEKNMLHESTTNYTVEADRAAKALNEGLTLLYPTDTVWGLGCDATNADAIEHIFEIKHRPANKSLIVLVDSVEMLQEYVTAIPQAALDIIKNATKPTTIIYEESKGLAHNISADKSVGIRIVNDAFCREMIHLFGKPIVSTSANISGEPTPHIFNEISQQIKDSVDYVVSIRQDEEKPSESSAIIKVIGEEFEIIRK